MICSIPFFFVDKSMALNKDVNGFGYFNDAVFCLKPNKFIEVFCHRQQKVIFLLYLTLRLNFRFFLITNFPKDLC